MNVKAVAGNNTHRRMLKAIAVQKLLERLHKPVIITSDDLTTLDIRTLSNMKHGVTGRWAKRSQRRCRAVSSGLCVYP
jgi:hypothetical protein